jgi:hypothetical protein
MTMPNSKEHKAKADATRAVLPVLAGSPEWTAIVAFYLAMHLVERLAACENVHNAKHPDRFDYLKKSRKHKRIHAAFSALFDASHVARYGTVNQFATAYPGDTVERILVKQKLASIENYVTGHFAAAGGSSPAPPTGSSRP